MEVKWCEVQATTYVSGGNCASRTDVLPDDIPPAKMDCWELRGQSDELGDVLEEQFEQIVEQTRLLSPTLCLSIACPGRGCIPCSRSLLVLVEYF